MKYVIDASVAARWYLSGEFHINAELLLERVLREPEQFAVPELFFFEVLAVLGRSHPHSNETYVEAFLPVVEGGVFRHPMTAGLARRTAQFMEKGLTGYDACYAGLAAELGAQWVTFDRQAHEKIAADRVSVDLGRGLPENW